MSSPKKRGEGTSCHHCKKRIRPNEMLKCTRGEIVPTNARKRKRPCVKKYCLHCIKTFYSTQYLDDNSSGSFICPACNDECRCAACRRRVMKARLKNDGSALENEADGQANSILESQTPDATNIEEGQVNGLLEILDSRPDVQDIIRRGMAMDFADDNAKILYVGHLIDQALTRPDVLALYYASSHGRANNCRIKTESDKEHIDDSTLPPDIANSNNNNNNSNSRSMASTSSSHRASKLKRNGSSRQSRTQSPSSNGSPSASNSNTNTNTRNGRNRSDSTSSTPSSTSHRSSRRKKRNHQEASYNDGDDHRDEKRKSRHKKQKYSPTADPEWNAVDGMNAINSGSNDTTHLAPASAVKQEPTNGTPLMASAGVSHHIHSVPLHHLNQNHNAHRHHDPQSKSNGTALMMNGISAPQPATMSLSGGNPMSFVNGINSAMAFGGPPHLGLPLPPFPPSHSVLDDGHCRSNANGSGNVLNPINASHPPHPSHSPHSAHPNPPHPSHSPLTMAPAVASTVSSEQTSNDPDSAQNGSMFPMNVTPSVMAGGPPLASM